MRLSQEVAALGDGALAERGRGVRGVTVRALAVGAVLVTLGSLWTCLVELVFHIGNMAEVVPAPSALVVFVGLSGVLIPLRLLSRRMGLSSRELVVVFMMCVMSLPMASQGLFGWFYPSLLALPHQAFEGNNENALYYMKDLPNYVIPKDREAFDAYANGVESDPPDGILARLWYELKGPVRWDVWLPVLGFWGVLLVALFAMMLFLNVILRKPMLEGERLRFPLTVIPREGCDVGEPSERRLVPKIFGDRFFLIGLGMVVTFHTVAALHFYYPTFPGWPGSLSYDIQGTLLTDHPWNKLQISAFNVMPLMIGVFYFVDPGVMSSILFFYLLTMAQKMFRGLTGMSGFRSSDGRETFPFIYEQWLGGMIAYGLAAAVFLRRHLLHVARRGLGLVRALPDERREAVSYPVAFWGFVVGMGVLVIWSHYAHLGAGWGLAFFFFLFVSVLAAIRIRGESGAPVVHMMAYIPFLFYAFLGTDTTGVMPACVMAHLFFLVHGQYMMLAPTQMEALKVSDEMGVSRRGMYVALILAFAFALLFGGFVRLQLNFRLGALNLHSWAFYCGSNRVANFDVSNNWKEPDPSVGSPADLVESGAIATGGAVMAVLMVLRRFVARFALHPVGYVVANSVSAGWMMWSVLVAWVAKTLIMKLGGIRVYRQLTPMFLGFIVGDAVMFLVFGIIGAIVASRGDTPFRMYVW